jgi:hypothetical protein
VYRANSKAVPISVSVRVPPKVSVQQSLTAAPTDADEEERSYLRSYDRFESLVQSNAYSILLPALALLVACLVETVDGGLPVGGVQDSVGAYGGLIGVSGLSKRTRIDQECVANSGDHRQVGMPHN